jgi:hypothetical protein
MVGLIVTIGGIIQAIITGRRTRRLQADIHASTQLTLIDMRKGCTESHERLAERRQSLRRSVASVKSWTAWTSAPRSAIET